ncbi:unnamed protein product [Ixodes pacificus]
MYPQKAAVHGTVGERVVLTSSALDRPTQEEDTELFHVVSAILLRHNVWSTHTSLPQREPVETTLSSRLFSSNLKRVGSYSHTRLVAKKTYLVRQHIRTFKGRIGLTLL